ncbi:MAG: hypothetical protein ACRBDI_04615 [Alphaproteobacteria bacterium]
MAGQNYNSNRISRYEDRISYIGENYIDEAIALLGLDAEVVKEKLWDDIGSAIMRHKPLPTTTGFTSSKAQLCSTKLTGNIKKTCDELNTLHYKNLSELSAQNKLREKMEEISLSETSAPRVKYSKGHGIRISQGKKPESNPQLYPFDQELYNALDALEVILKRLKQADATLEKEKKAKGKNKNYNADEIILALCHIYKAYTGKNPHATTSGGSISGERQINGQIIPFIQLILPFFNYERADGNEALQKVVERLEKSKEHSNIWAAI